MRIFFKLSMVTIGMLPFFALSIMISLFVLRLAEIIIQS